VFRSLGSGDAIGNPTESSKVSHVRVVCESRVGRRVMYCQGHVGSVAKDSAVSFQVRRGKPSLMHPYGVQTSELLASQGSAVTNPEWGEMPAFNLRALLHSGSTNRWSWVVGIFSLQCSVHLLTKLWYVCTVMYVCSQ